MLATKEDLLFAALDSHDRSIDAVALVELCRKTYPDVNAVADKLREATRVLQAGAFSRPGRLWGKKWLPDAGNNGRLEVEYCNDVQAAVESWVNISQGIHKAAWSHRLVVNDASGELVYVIRVHHAYSDGLSVQFMTEAILSQALMGSAESTPISQQLKVRKFHGKKPGNPYEQRPFVQPVTKDGKFSGAKRYVCRALPLPVAQVEQGLKPTGLTSVLIAASIRGMQASELPVKSPAGVCLPVSIRDQGSTAIGNGASRIILFDKPERNVLQLAQYVKEQIIWNLANGGWHFPDVPVRWIPLFLLNFLIRLSTTVKSSHRGSFIYSGFDARSLVDKISGVKNVMCLGPLTRSYAFMIMPIVMADRINLVITYNDGCFDRDEMKALLDCVSEQFQAASRASID